MSTVPVVLFEGQETWNRPSHVPGAWFVGGIGCLWCDDFHCVLTMSKEMGPKPVC